MNNQNQQRQSPGRPVDPSQYSFNIGLIKITTNRNQGKMPELPQTSTLDPSVGRMEQRLKAIVDLQTFETILLEVLQPQVKNRSMLVPVHFRAHLVQLQKFLKDYRGKMGQQSAEAIDALLADLKSQLAEEAGRNELLEQYRLMILMG
ncbi:MAG: hypothetical protein LBS68_01890 [Puniceicoccales bacterium]|jgi:hypothetical protein|nr:hypothetical protein [Puniceicoccales bacterium]